MFKFQLFLLIFLFVTENVLVAGQNTTIKTCKLNQEESKAIVSVENKYKFYLKFFEITYSTWNELEMNLLKNIKTELRNKYESCNKKDTIKLNITSKSFFPKIGQDFMMTCFLNVTSFKDLKSLQWIRYKNGQKEILTKNLISLTPDKYDIDQQVKGHFELTILNFAKMDLGTYVCQVLDKSNRIITRSLINLTIPSPGSPKPPLMPPNPKCASIKKIELCKKYNYTTSAWPNLLDHMSDEAAVSNFNAFLGSCGHKMDETINAFACSVYFPPCIEEMKNSKYVLLPCKSFCEKAKKSCGSNGSWPKKLNCSLFPLDSDKMCIKNLTTKMPEIEYKIKKCLRYTKSVDLKCPRKFQKLNIIAALYGREKGDKECPCAITKLFGYPACGYGSNSLTYIKNLCQGENSCLLQIDKMKNYCIGRMKLLYLTYKCV